jgi:L-rhamnose mutarotase
MKEFVLTTDLRDDPEVIRQYRAYHAAVWPEVVASLKNVGFRDARIYLLGRRLVMILRVEDDFDATEASRRHRDAHPRIREWEELMDTFQERPMGTTGDGKWAPMEKLWELA